MRRFYLRQFFSRRRSLRQSVRKLNSFEELLSLEIEAKSLGIEKKMLKRIRKIGSCPNGIQHRIKILKSWIYEKIENSKNRK